MRDPISTTMGGGRAQRENPDEGSGHTAWHSVRWEVDTNFKPHSLGKDLCSKALTYSEFGSNSKV